MDIVTYALLNRKIKDYASNVDEWLEENVDPATGYVLDRSLQMENAASPADIVGDINDDVGELRNTLNQVVSPNAGSHNSIFRGKSLGSTITAEQWTAIGAGTFENLFIGDYWTINGVNWRIAAFDYWLRCGDTECTTHHAVIVPDSNLKVAGGTTHCMNKSNTTTGAYVGSGFYSGTNSDNTENTAKAECIAIVDGAFGASHILSHREYFANATTSEYQSAGAWYDSTVDMMNEQMVYGCRVFSNVINGTNVPSSYTIDKGQLPLFALAPQYICNRTDWWLRDVVSSIAFAIANNQGLANCTGASNEWVNVRPAFAIKA
jgi:hypothetical protein